MENGKNFVPSSELFLHITSSKLPELTVAFQRVMEAHDRYRDEGKEIVIDAVLCMVTIDKNAQTPTFGEGYLRGKRGVDGGYLGVYFKGAEPEDCGKRVACIFTLAKKEQEDERRRPLAYLRCEIIPGIKTDLDLVVNPGLKAFQGIDENLPTFSGKNFIEKLEKVLKFTVGFRRNTGAKS